MCPVLSLTQSVKVGNGSARAGYPHGTLLSFITLDINLSFANPLFPRAQEGITTLTAFM